MSNERLRYTTEAPSTQQNKNIYYPTSPETTSSTLGNLALTIVMAHMGTGSLALPPGAEAVTGINTSALEGIVATVEYADYHKQRQ